MFVVAWQKKTKKKRLMVNYIVNMIVHLMVVFRKKCFKWWHAAPINMKPWFGDRTIFFITTLTFGLISVHLWTDLYFLWRFDLPTATELSISQHIDFSHTHRLTHSSCLLKHTYTLALSTNYNVTLTAACKNRRTEHEMSLLTSHNSWTGSKLS